MATKTATRSDKAARIGKLRVVATDSRSAKVCRASLKRLPPRDRSKIDLLSFSEGEAIDLPLSKAWGTLYISRMSDIPNEPAESQWRVKESKHLLFVEDLPVEAVPSRLHWLGVRNPQRLHVVTERNPDALLGLVYRLFSGITHRDGPPSIVDAWVEENKELVLLAPSFERMRVPLAKLERFIGNKPDEVAAFEIDEDGRFLYWPDADVHLGWDQFKQIVDPAAALSAKQKSSRFNKRYGAAIRSFREEHGLKQADISGVTDRHLRRVEHGEQAVSKGMLQALADAHQMTLEEYLKGISRRMTRGS